MLNDKWDDIKDVGRPKHNLKPGDLFSMEVEINKPLGGQPHYEVTLNDIQYTYYPNKIFELENAKYIGVYGDVELIRVRECGRTC